VRRALALAALPALALLASPAVADPPGPEPEELRVVVARRAPALTGTPVRIGELRYELIGSRFVGARIAAGPRGHPYLKLPSLIVELALLSGGGRTIASIEADGAQASIPGEWLGRALPRRARGALTVKSVKVCGARLTIRLGEGRRPVLLEGVELAITDLAISAGSANDPLRATGKLKLSVRRATLGVLELQRIAVQGKLEGDKLSVEVKVAGMGGKATLAGVVGLGERLGPIDLKGQVEVRPGGAAGPRVWGPLSLKGKSAEALSLEGKLRSAGELEARKGREELPPLLRMRLKVGKRELRGTLADWQLR